MDHQTTPTILNQIRRQERRWGARLSELASGLSRTVSGVREAIVGRPLPILVPIRVRSRTMYPRR